jgi:hypothetical protein
LALKITLTFKKTYPKKMKQVALSLPAGAAGTPSRDKV